MSGRNYDSTRLRSNVDPLELFRRLSSCLGVDFGPVDASWIVSQEMPNLDQSLPEFRDMYLLKEVLRKYPGFDLGIDTRQVALDSFFEGERANAITNDRLFCLESPENPDVMRVFLRASRKVSQVLGEFNWKWFADGLRFGPGATTGVPSDGGVYKKLSGKPHVTSAAYEMAVHLIQSTPSWAYHLMESGNHGALPVRQDVDLVDCVPKNAKTDRTISVQPTLNTMFQLAVAYVMRRKLARWGINLNDQTINQRRALEGSEDGRLATVDLTNASGSITCGLVWQMVGNHPVLDKNDHDPTWYRLFTALRTDRGLLDGEIHNYELFSAMGNGYTFELESLIFWALTTEACEILGVPSDVTVFGDDIVCPREVVPLLEEVFAYSGLSLNSDKSFYDDGPSFRESCGKHYLRGMDVTPFYVTEPLTTVTEVVLLCNNLRRWAAADMVYGVDGRVKPVYDWLLGHLPKRALKTAIPLGDSDDGLVMNFDEASPSTVVDHGPRAVLVRVSDGKFKSVPTSFPSQKIGYRARCVSLKRRLRRPEGPAHLLLWLYSRSYRRFKAITNDKRFSDDNRSTDVLVPTRKQETKYHTRLVTEWNDIGPWL